MKRYRNNSKVHAVYLGVFAPPALACIRSWGRQGFEVSMICVDKRKDRIIASRYLKDYVILHPDDCYTDKGLSIIRSFLIRNNATGITSMNPYLECWLNDNLDKLPDKLRIWFPSNATIKSLENKENQIRVAESVGLDLLPTYYFFNVDQLEHRVSSEHFPLCLRPSELGSVKPNFKVKLVYSEAEIIQFIRSLKTITKPIIGQPFRNLPNIVVHGSRTTEGITLPVKSFIVERKFEGITLIIRPFLLDSEIIKKCIRFTNSFKITGCYHFEFLYETELKKHYFLELNCRLGGTTAKVYRCGYDEPAYAIQAYGVDIPNQEEIKNITLTNYQSLLKFFYCNLAGMLSVLDFPEESKIKRSLFFLLALVNCKDEVWDWRDIRGSLSLYLDNLRRALF